MVWLILAAALFTGEQLLKNYFEKKPADETDKPLFGGKILLRRFHNKGAILCHLSEKPKLVTFLSAAALGVFIGAFFPEFIRKKNGIMKTGLVLLMAGGASNIYDRFRRGYVVDYFSICTDKWKKLKNVIFNIADFFIFIGTFLVIVGTVFKRK